MNIKNFSIIAHVDHGKSTLADRLLEVTGTITGNKMQPQLLDSLALERERGITIKLAPVRMKYKSSVIASTSMSLRAERSNLSVNSAKQSDDEIASSSGSAGAPRNDEKEYTLNLIDTPGHVDFSYEVSRSLAAVEGAILLVDATSGIQAQTLSHGLSALEQNLTLIPVINKVDLLSTLRSPNGDLKIDFERLDEIKIQLIDTFGFLEEEILLVSGKTGKGVKELLEEIIKRVPSPKIDDKKPLRALIFDSFFDTYKGVVAGVRIVDGEVPKVGTKIKFLGTGAIGEVLEKGYFSPGLTPIEDLKSGEIGYIATGIKQSDLVRVGDTISHPRGVIEPLPGYKEVKPMVYVGLYPIEQSEFLELKEVLNKFRLTDPAFTYVPENSQALGAGFRCGFLGLLHAEVVQQRLSEEFNIDLLATTPSVEYLVEDVPITNPADLPQGENIKDLKEPWVKLRIFTPQEFIGGIMDLVSEKRGIFQNQTYFGNQVELLYEMPLSEMITDFYDKLKSVSSGFASLDWDFLEFREIDAVRVDILVGGEKVDALSTIIVRSRAESVGRRLVSKLKDVLPRQNFEIALQAIVGGKIIARETISPFRKDVIAKLYGGDRTRKDKLLDKQKKGKKKMKMIGRVEIPQEAFLSILKS
ncbi:MAG: translation elongation factor 4 [Candidatus Daviesbacteria bacterium]|nr:translation elongation factor 4 [Candidatus Daviesbacteria bacterium]